MGIGQLRTQERGSYGGLIVPPFFDRWMALAEAMITSCPNHSSLEEPKFFDGLEKEQWEQYGMVLCEECPIYRVMPECEAIAWRKRQEVMEQRKDSEPNDGETKSEESGSGKEEI
jgi:hypothetical protein